MWLRGLGCNYEMNMRPSEAFENCKNIYFLNFYNCYLSIKNNKKKYALETYKNGLLLKWYEYTKSMGNFIKKSKPLFLIKKVSKNF